MYKNNVEEIDVDEIMQKIREEIAKRRKPSVTPEEPSIDNKRNYNIVNQPQRETRFYRFAKKIGNRFEHYGLHRFVVKVKKLIPARFKYETCFTSDKFLEYHDEEFIRNAYREILKREPDATGFNHYLLKLRNGRLNKIEILGRLRYSREGRQRQIPVKKILIPYLMNTSYRVPIVGYLLRLLLALLRLPVILRNIYRFADITNLKLAEFKLDIDRIKVELGDLKLNVLDQERRLSLFIEEAKKRLPEDVSKEQIEKMYVAFENQFRGTREDIKERLRVYLPYIGQVRAGTNETPILDLGCGRGEWLELLRERGLKAYGVDINRIFVEQCRGYGLDVVEGDLIQHLRTLPDSSYGAVTGFHVVEHLEFNSLIHLLDETVRVLKPGGIAIFETPNPENIFVGSCNFYLDPTHKKPLPSPMMKFMAEARGLCRVEIVNLHPRTGVLKMNGSDLIERFNGYFYGPQDYAVVGYKT